MKIHIKQKDGRNIFIPVPLFLATFSCDLTEFIIAKSGRHIPEDVKQYLDCIDFKALGKSIHYLKEHKGLKFVEVKSASGEEVTIEI